MKYLPINLDVAGKQVLIVGGGAVALRKCGPLLKAGARVRVVAPTLCARIAELATAGKIRYISKQFEPMDIAGMFLVYAATDLPEVNRAVADEAARKGILAEITDAPALGNFTSPAIFSQGDLLLAVSTGGKAPALAAAVRRELAGHFGPEYAKTARLIGMAREKLLTQTANRTYNEQILKELADRLPLLFAADAIFEIDKLLQDRCGPGFALATLDAAPEDSP
jgi:precorrin-2 dehydrogenase/sirohydrochlorin ferrochelatase